MDTFSASPAGKDASPPVAAYAAPTAAIAPLAFALALLLSPANCAPGQPREPLRPPWRARARAQDSAAGVRTHAGSDGGHLCVAR